MSIFAIADLHLCFGDTSKSMEVFGKNWENYTSRIADNWQKLISPKDLVLIAGDISWAMKPEDAIKDLKWIDALNGTKVILKGNHDYWWGSYSKVKALLPPSIFAIQNNAFHWENFSIAGSRLWDSDEFNFDSYVLKEKNPYATKDPVQAELKQTVYERELKRLELSLDQLALDKIKIAMTHFPPIGADLSPSKASLLFEKYKIHTSVFGHLHSLNPQLPLFGKAANIRYILTSSDFLNFTPIQIF